MTQNTDAPKDASAATSAPAAPTPAALVPGLPLGGAALASSAGGAGGLRDYMALDFLWRTHSRLNEDARFADTKAIAVAMVESGLIATLYATKLHQLVFSHGLWLSGALGILAYVTLAGGMFCSAWAVKPRLAKAHIKGYLFWESIRGYPTAAEFWNAFHAEDGWGLARHMADHVHTLAGVCRRKYFWMGLSMRALLVGAMTGVLALVLKDVLA